jgi:hypothetical protein
VGEFPTAEQTDFIKRYKKVQRDTYKGREGGLSTLYNKANKGEKRQEEGG